MTSADEVFAACGLPVLLDQHGQVATYTDLAGTSTAVTLLEVTTAAEVAPSTQSGDRDKRRTMRAQISKEELAAVQVYETVTLGTEVWTVSAIERESGATWLLKLERREAHEVARPGYRRR